MKKVRRKIFFGTLSSSSYTMYRSYSWVTKNKRALHRKRDERRAHLSADYKYFKDYTSPFFFLQWRDECFARENDKRKRRVEFDEHFFLFFFFFLWFQDTEYRNKSCWMLDQDVSGILYVWFYMLNYIIKIIPFEIDIGLWLR